MMMVFICPKCFMMVKTILQFPTFQRKCQMGIIKERCSIHTFFTHFITFYKISSNIPNCLFLFSWNHHMFVTILLYLLFLSEVESSLTLSPNSMHVTSLHRYAGMEFETISSVIFTYKDLNIGILHSLLKNEFLLHHFWNSALGAIDVGLNNNFHEISQRS